MYVHAVHTVCTWCPQRPDQHVRSPWDWSYRMVVSLSHPEDHPILLTTEMFLQPPFYKCLNLLSLMCLLVEEDFCISFSYTVRALL